MKKFTVEISRTEYSTKTFEVTAKNKKEAKEIALDDAYNTAWDRGGNVEYEIEDIDENN